MTALTAQIREHLCRDMRRRRLSMRGMALKLGLDHSVLARFLNDPTRGATSSLLDPAYAYLYEHGYFPRHPVATSSPPARPERTVIVEAVAG